MSLAVMPSRDHRNRSLDRTYIETERYLAVLRVIAEPLRFCASTKVKMDNVILEVWGCEGGFLLQETGDQGIWLRLPAWLWLRWR